MGDITDMILSGVLCECCGDYVGEEVGHPVSCSCCEMEKNGWHENEESK